MSKNKGRNRKAVEQALEPQPPTILVAWNEYFQTGSLGDWQRLMQNLGFQEEFTSKSQCRRALKGVWVNIYDFMEAVQAGRPVRRFDSRRELAEYTQRTRRYFPKRRVPKGSPLRQLLAHVN